jgi:hypothetical protein
MPTQIVNVCKLQTAKVLAVLYFVISAPFLLFYAALMQLTDNGGSSAWGMALYMMVLYPLLGFVFTFFGAWIYNGVARKIGGIQFTVAEVEGK